MVEGKQRTLLVHRKGSTRAFPPHHPLIPVDYQLTGQPVLIGGTMGTCRCMMLIMHCTDLTWQLAWSTCNAAISCSYVLTGTEKGFSETFGSTCHGAVSSNYKIDMFVFVHVHVHTYMLMSDSTLQHAHNTCNGMFTLYACRGVPCREPSQGLFAYSCSMV